MDRWGPEKTHLDTRFGKVLARFWQNPGTGDRGRGNRWNVAPELLLSRRSGAIGAKTAESRVGYDPRDGAEKPGAVCQ